MSHRMISLRSVWHGFRAMSSWGELFRHWAVHWDTPGFWLHLWTPIWHKGRGPYVSMGLGWLKVYRGY